MGMQPALVRTRNSRASSPACCCRCLPPLALGPHLDGQLLAQRLLRHLQHGREPAAARQQADVLPLGHLLQGQRGWRAKHMSSGGSMGSGSLGSGGSSSSGGSSAPGRALRQFLPSCCSPPASSWAAGPSHPGCRPPAHAHAVRERSASAGLGFGQTHCMPCMELAALPWSTQSRTPFPPSPRLEVVDVLAHPAAAQPGAAQARAQLGAATAEPTAVFLQPPGEAASSRQAVGL